MDIEPTFKGYIEDERDALLILQATLDGKLKHIPRRPYEIERPYLIISGNIFVFVEEISGIKRWTDGVSWSPSRIAGKFLMYKEVDKDNLNLNSPSIKNKKNGSKIKLPPLVSSNSSNSSNSTITENGNGEQQLTLNAKENSSTSLRSVHPMKYTGLIKKTISVNLKRPGVNYYENFHIISYYTVDDVKQNRLITPKDSLVFRNISPIPELITAMENTSLGNVKGSKSSQSSSSATPLHNSDLMNLDNNIAHNPNQQYQQQYYPHHLSINQNSMMHNPLDHNHDSNSMNMNNSQILMKNDEYNGNNNAPYGHPMGGMYNQPPQSPSLQNGRYQLPPNNFNNPVKNNNNNNANNGKGNNLTTTSTGNGTTGSVPYAYPTSYTNSDYNQQQVSQNGSYPYYYSNSNPGYPDSSNTQNGLGQNNGQFSSYYYSNGDPNSMPNSSMNAIPNSMQNSNSQYPMYALNVNMPYYNNNNNTQYSRTQNENVIPTPLSLNNKNMSGNSTSSSYYNSNGNNEILTQGNNHQVTNQMLLNSNTGNFSSFNSNPNGNSGSSGMPNSNPVNATTTQLTYSSYPTQNRLGNQTQYLNNNNNNNNNYAGNYSNPSTYNNDNIDNSNNANTNNDTATNNTIINDTNTTSTSINISSNNDINAETNINANNGTTNTNISSNLPPTNPISSNLNNIITTNPAVGSTLAAASSENIGM